MQADKYMVLIIDDDPDDVEFLKEAIEPPQNILCESVPTLADAEKRVLDKNRPVIDVLLIDLRLPNGLGLEVVSKMQSAFPNIPMLVITGLPITSTSLILAGAHDVVRKNSWHKEDVPKAIYKTIARHLVRPLYEPIKEELTEVKAETMRHIKNLSELQSGIVSARSPAETMERSKSQTVKMDR